MITAIIIVSVSLIGLLALWLAKNLEFGSAGGDILKNISKYGDPLLGRLFVKAERVFSAIHAWRFHGVRTLKVSLREFCVQLLINSKKFIDRQFMYFMDLLRGRRLLGGRDTHSIFLRDILDYKNRLTRER